MALLRRLSGTGRLRPMGARAADAGYWLTVQRHDIGPQKGELVVSGQVQTTMSTLLAAYEGRATLTLQDGGTYNVELRHLTATIAEITVLPPFGRLAKV